MKVRFYLSYFAKPALIFFLLAIFLPDVTAQNDSIHPSMSLDLGITRGKNIYLWPVFKRIKTQDLSQIQVLFPLFEYSRKYADSSSHNHLFPLYWNNKKKNHSDFRLISTYYPSLIHAWRDSSLRSFSFLEFVPYVNLFQLSSSPDGLNIQNNFFFFIWQKNDRKLDKSYFVVFPFSWYFQHHERTSYTFFPIFSHGKSSNSDYFALTPLFWHLNNRYGKSNTLFPLVWNKTKYTQTDTIRSTTIFPVYWSKHGDINSYDVLFPILWNYRNKDSRYLTLLPAFSYGHSDIRKSSYLSLTPLFWKFKSENSKGTLFAPIWFHLKDWKKKDTTNYNVLFPLWYSKVKRDHSTRILFPIVWDFNSPEYHTFTVFPLLSFGADKTLTKGHLILTPLFWRTYQKNIIKTTLFPIWWYRRTYFANDTVVFKSLFPVWWDYSSHQFNTKVLFPLLWALKGPAYKSFTFIPFCSFGNSRDGSTSHLGITPLYWHFSGNSGHSNSIFPIWWNRKSYLNNDTSMSNVIFPIWWSHKDKSSLYRVLFPFAWQIDNPKYSSITVFPFFSAGKAKNFYYHHLVITPFFWQLRNSRGYRDVLFPLVWLNSKITSDNIIYSKLILPFWWSRSDKYSGKELLFPVWWSSQGYDFSNKVFFPFVWSFKNPQYRSLTIFPIYSWGRSSDSLTSHLMATPLFFHFSSPQRVTNTVFPLFWNRRIFWPDDTLKSTTLFPLWWRQKTRDSAYNVLVPVYWNFRNENFHTIAILPFFFYKSFNKTLDKQLFITPVFWHHQTASGHDNVIFPLFWDKMQKTPDDLIHTTTIFPLYWSKQSGKYNNIVIFPVFWKTITPDYRSLTVIPFFSIGNSPDKSSSHLAITPFYYRIKVPGNISNLLFPAFWNSMTYDDKDTTRSTYVFPVWWSQQSKNAINRTLFPLLWYNRDQESHSITVVPFFSYKASWNNLDKQLFIVPLFWHTRSATGSMSVLFPIYWHNNQITDNDVIHSTCIFPIYWSEESQKANWKVFFPFVWSFKNPIHHSLTILPLYYYRSTTDNRSSHLMVTPLYHHIVKHGKVSNLILPLWYNSRKLVNGDTINTNVVFPLWWSKQTRLSGYSILFPLIWVNHNPVKKAAKVFPLFWWEKSNNHQFWTVFPILWSTRNPYYSSFTFFPAFSFGYSPGNQKHHLMLTPLFYSFKNGSNRNVGLFPVFNFRKQEDESHYNFLLVLIRGSHHLQRSSFSMLWPLIDRTKDVNSVSFRIAPIVWYKKTSDFNYFSIQPFWYQFNSKTERNRYLLWQLLVMKNELNVCKSTNFIWKTVFSDRYSNGDHEFRFLYLLFADVKKNGETEKSLFPLYHSFTKKSGDRSLSLFFYFYTRFTQKIPEINDYYQEERIFWFLRLRSNYKQLKQQGKDKYLKRR